MRDLAPHPSDMYKFVLSYLRCTTPSYPTANAGFVPKYVECGTRTLTKDTNLIKSRPAAVRVYLQSCSIIQPSISFVALSSRGAESFISKFTIRSGLLMQLRRKDPIPVKIYFFGPRMVSSSSSRGRTLIRTSTSSLARFLYPGTSSCSSISSLRRGIRVS